MSKVHFIGIAGSAIAPLAVMMRDLGWEVTGSEHNKVWEPAKSVLAKKGIKYTELEYDLKLVKEADLVIIGNSALLQNPNHPEFIYAKKLGKEIKPFPYLVGKYITSSKSIVIAGSYGKSTITTAVACFLDKLGKNPNFLIGGKPIDYDDGVRVSNNTEYSVVEGDEYISAFNYDMTPKFLYYEPDYTLITSLKWDHADIYRTEEDYIESFKKLADITRKKIVINVNGENISRLNLDGCVKYGIDGKGDPDFFARNIKPDGEFELYNGENLIGKFKTKLIGKHNIEDLVGAIAIIFTACENSVDINALKNAVNTFNGTARRLETVGQNIKGATIIDDFAHSPVKAKATLDALRYKYPDKKIIAVYYPRLSLNQNRETLKWYAGAFDNADEVIIPRIIAKKETPKEDRIYGKDITDAIKETQPNVQYMPIEDNMLDYLDKISDKNTIIVIMSSSSVDLIRERLLNG